MTAYAVPLADPPALPGGDPPSLRAGVGRGRCPKCRNWLHDRDQDGDPTCVICGLVTVRRAPAPYTPSVEPHRKVYRRRLVGVTA
jgi:hypothetical protein